jgi:hypothetical protein
MAAQAMQGQTEQFRQQAQQQRATVPTFPSGPAPAPAQMPASNFDNPLAGLMSFLGGVNAPQQQQQAPPAPTRTIPLKAPSREMKMPSVTGLGIGDILNKINKEEKKIVTGNSAPMPPTQAASFANGSGNTAPMTFASGPPPPQPARKSVLKRSGGSERKSAKNSVVIKL